MWPQSPYSHSQKNKSPSSAMGYRHKEFADLCWKPPGGHHPHSVGQDTQISRNQAWKSAKRKSDWPWPPPVSSQETLVPRGTPSLLFIVLLSPAGGEALSVVLAAAMIRPETEKPTEPREQSGRTETGDLHCSKASEAHTSVHQERSQKTGSLSWRCIFQGVLFFSETLCTSPQCFTARVSFSLGSGLRQPTAEAWVQIPTLEVPSCVTPRKWLNLFRSFTYSSTKWNL